MSNLTVRSLICVACLLAAALCLPAQVTLTAFPNPSVLGQPVTLTATVSGVGSVGGSLSVAFYDGVNLLGSRTLLEGGVAILTTTLLPPGAHSLRARFQSTLSDPVPQVVTARAAYALATPIYWGAASTASTVAAGDFNGDGKLDVAVADGSLTVLLGDGNGHFQTAREFPLAGMNPTYLVSGDFDGDGNLDVAASGPAGVFVFSGAGDGSFRSSVKVGPAGFAAGIAAGDFNGDGVSDLAVDFSSLTILVFARGGSYSTVQYAYSAISIAVADFNGDGIADLGTASGVAIGNGDGTFKPPLTLGIPGPFVAAGDLNGDGKADLVVRGSAPASGSFAVLLGKGDGTFRSPINVTWTYLEPDFNTSDRVSMAITDVNGDGIPDVVLGSTDVQIFFGVGDGTFTPDSPALYRIGLPVRAIAAADWNGDGAIDVLFTIPYTLAVLNSFSSPRAALGIAVNHNATVTGSGLVNYTITVSNAANADATSGPVIVAETRAGVFSMSGNGWACAERACTRSDSLAPGGSYPPITAVLSTIDPIVTFTGPFPNVVTVFGGSSRPASATDSFRLPPLAPVLITPNLTADVPLNVTLAWTGPGAAFFDVYFGTSSPPPLVASNFAGTRYTPGPLAPCTPYYWKAVGKSDAAAVSSTVYSFITMASVRLNKDVDVFSQPGGNGSVQVATTSGCSWKVSWFPPDIVSVTSGNFGLGNGTVSYSVAPNTGVASRVGYVLIADQLLPILQDGTGPSTRCVTHITGPAFIDSAPQNLTLNVTTDPNCNWNLVDNHVDWVTLPVSQNTAIATVAANTSGASRTDDFVAIPFGYAAFFTPFTVTQRATPVTFADVPLSYTFFDAIGFLRARGITDGCASAPPRFCPDDNITRGQMAVFIVRSIMGGDNFSYSATPYFSDAPANHPFFKWIQKMWELGITNGCGASTYCPDSPVTRGQMAVFIIRTRLGANATYIYPLDPMFGDISNSFYYTWIQKMGQLGITTGCAPGLYCPDAPVTRGQMAVFVMRGAFNQLLPSPRPIVVSIAPNAASPGETLTVTITGQNTFFTGGTPQVLAGPGIAASNITVNSATSITAQLTVAANAAPGPRSITVTIPGEIEATLPNGFKVQ